MRSSPNKGIEDKRRGGEHEHGIKPRHRLSTSAGLFQWRARRSRRHCGTRPCCSPGRPSYSRGGRWPAAADGGLRHRLRLGCHCDWAGSGLTRTELLWRGMGLSISHCPPRVVLTQESLCETGEWIPELTGCHLGLVPGCQ